MWVRSLGCENLLEEEMATHAHILAREIPWTEEPVGPLSTASQGVKCDQSDLARMQVAFMTRLLEIVL